MRWWENRRALLDDITLFSLSPRTMGINGY